MTSPNLLQYTLAFSSSGFFSTPHLILEVIECSEKLMSGGEKRWFQIRHDIAQAKRFSVLLETVHLRHLVSQVSA